MRYYEDSIGRRISKKFGSDKVIIDIKNRNLSIKFLRYYYWAIPLGITLGILVNIYNFFIILTTIQFTLLMIGFVIILLTTIVTFLSSIYEIYIENNYIVLENKLKIKKCIDISKYPRVYIRQRIFNRYSPNRETSSEHEEYVVNIEQNNVLIKIPVKIKGIEQFIDNFITDTLEKLTKEEQEKSINKEEKFFFDMNEICKSGKVIGVKDNHQNLKIKHGSNTNTIILTISLVISLAIILLCMIYNIYHFVVGFTLLVILFIILLIRENFKNTLRISYYEHEIIQINQHILDYQNDILKLEIRAIQVPFENEKYKYSLTIHTRNNSYSIFLNGIEKEKFAMFINNLIFEKCN